jgi:hypothetical protein
MAQTALQNLGINFEHTLGVDDWKNSYDANWIVTDWSLQPWIVNRTTTAEPGGPPTRGDAYILLATRTGTDWGTDSGSVQHRIAIYAAIPGLPDSSNWIYVLPKEGMRVYDRNEDVWYEWTGSLWVSMGKKLRLITAASYEPVLADYNGTLYIDNAAHTLNIADNATEPKRVGSTLEIINENASAITVTDDVAVTWRTGGQNLVSAGIPANSRVLIQATGTDEWFVLEAGAHPT